MAKFFHSIMSSGANFFSKDVAGSTPTQSKNNLKKFDALLAEWLHDQNNGNSLHRGIAADRLFKAMRGYSNTMDLSDLQVELPYQCIALLPKNVQAILPHGRKMVTFRDNAHPSPQASKSQLREFDALLKEWQYDEKNGDPKGRGIAADRLFKAMRGYSKSVDLNKLGINIRPKCIDLLPNTVQVLEPKFAKRVRFNLQNDRHQLFSPQRQVNASERASRVSISLNLENQSLKGNVVRTSMKCLVPTQESTLAPQEQLEEKSVTQAAVEKAENVSTPEEWTFSFPRDRKSIDMFTVAPHWLD